MKYYRGGIDATFKYTIVKDGETIKGFGLAWDIDLGIDHWVKLIHGDGIEILSTEINGPHLEEVGAFFTAREKIDLDFSLNRIDDAIESYEVLQEAVNIWDYAQKSRSCPEVGSIQWFHFVELIELWLKQRKEYGV